MANRTSQRAEHYVMKMNIAETHQFSNLAKTKMNKLKKYHKLTGIKQCEEGN